LYYYQLYDITMAITENILSIFLNVDRTYLTGVCTGKKGLEVIYVNSTNNPIDLEILNENFDQPGVYELQELLKNLPFQPDKLTMSLPAESLFVTQFPGQANINQTELKALINLELRHNFPQFDIKDFTCTLLQMSPKLNGDVNIVAVVVQKATYRACTELVKNINLPIQKIEVSQLNAQNSLAYNYPEYKDKTIVIFGFQNNFIDISLISSRKTAYFQLRSYSSEAEIPGICKQEIEKILFENSEVIDSVMAYGISLTQQTLKGIREALHEFIPEVNRLNAFRMTSTSLEQRDKEYCIRTAHIFPSCIGSTLPEYHERLKLF